MTSARDPPPTGDVGRSRHQPHVLREYALLADGERGAVVGPARRHRLAVRTALGRARRCSPR